MTQANSFSNFVDRPELSDDLHIYDVTLRDGEQTPGVSFSVEEKKEIAHLLDEAGVGYIEAGFPAVSDDERRAVGEVVGIGTDAKISCLARCLEDDIDSVIETGADAVGVFIAGSDRHLSQKYGITREEAAEKAFKTVEYASDHGIEVRFAVEDSTRSDPDFLRCLYTGAEERGVDMVGIADTVGALTPPTTRAMVTKVRDWVEVPVSVHCHDDLGLSVANTVAAAEEGAVQLHTTVNGIGENAGNTPLEEVAVVLSTQYSFDVVETEKLSRLSEVVEERSGIEVSPTKPVVGKNAFRYESGVHIEGIANDPETYEVYPPEKVGGEREFEIGKHSGRKAVEFIAEREGIEIEDEIEEVVEDLKSGKDTVSISELVEEVRER
ncbi:MAG: homoaconitate hydratase [Halobacteria archaeon]|nr:homoaconitate hydratase [Halobacteria archaeon]